MKRYYFNVRNSNGVIINKINVVANSLQFAKDKVAFKLECTYKSMSCLYYFTFDYHKKVQNVLK